MQDTKSKEQRAKSKEQTGKPNILTYLLLSSTFPLAKNDFGTLFLKFDIDSHTPPNVEMSKCQIVEVANYKRNLKGKCQIDEYDIYNY
jgi:hypothetical protein